MRIVKNENLIQTRGRWARILMPLGLVFLFGGLILSMQQGNPTFQIAAWGALIAGVICSSIGIGLADKWLSVPGRPRADQALETALTSLDIKHKLYSWALPAGEQVLLSPAGLTVFLVKNQEGVIECQNGKWKNRQGLWKMLSGLSRERLGNPTKDLARDMAQAEELDDLLWAFDPDEYLPHQIAGTDEDEDETPVLIATPETDASSRPLVINLRDDVWLQPCERILEVVPADPAAREPLRERWKQYKALGFELNKHDM